MIVALIAGVVEVVPAGVGEQHFSVERTPGFPGQGSNLRCALSAVVCGDASGVSRARK